MQMASPAEKTTRICGYITTCWVQEATAAPQIPVKIGIQDVASSLDTGSLVTLIKPQFAADPLGPPITVACIHGDTKSYRTCRVEVQTPQVSFVIVAGVVDKLPVDVLVGRDCLVFQRFWSRGGHSL